MTVNNQHKIQVSGVTFWLSNISKEQGWFRVFGAGFAWKHERLGLLFSMRNGH